jgi:16S rRNA (cytosine967-C5)-methyltransferase
MSRRLESTPRRPESVAGRRVTPRRSPQDDVRAVAAWVVDRTLASLSPVDAFLDGALTRLDERDRPLLRELALGTLRWLRRLDHVIAAASHREFASIAPELRSILRVATYQILFLDRVPAHAAVDEAVNQAHARSHSGGASFVNAVLRRIARTPTLEAWPVVEADPVRRLALETSHPDFLVRRWLDRFGAAAARGLLEADNRSKPLHLLAFRDRGGRELAAEALIEAGIEVVPSALAPLGLTVREGLPWTTAPFRDGQLYVQDEASQVAALVPPPVAGERILDCAAAPGGKAFSLLAFEPGVRLVAADVDVERVALMRRNAGRLGRAMPILVADAGRLPSTAAFDRVVVDLPCSGTGTLRKHPELKWRLSEGEIARLASLGGRLLSGAARTVLPGGLLVAITCSLEMEENEETVASFLAREPQFRLLPLAERLAPPIDRYVVGPGLWRLPTADGHDGFTVSVLQRVK